MLVWQYLLKCNMMLVKCVFDVLGVLIAKDVEVGWVAMISEKFVHLFPGQPDVSSLLVCKRNCIDGIVIVVVVQEYVVIALAGYNQEIAGMIGMWLRYFSHEKKHGADGV